MILKPDVSTSFTGLPWVDIKTKIQYGGSLFAYSTCNCIDLPY